MWIASRAFALFFFLICIPAAAQNIGQNIGGGIGAFDRGISGNTIGKAGTPPVTYVGPNDVVSGATVCLALRGCATANAVAKSNAVLVRRASDNATKNIVVLGSGALDVATANTFAGTDATCTTAVASGTTTLTLAGCSSTPTAGDSIATAGFSAYPVYIVSVGTFVGGSGTVTLSQSETVSIGTTKLQVALYVAEMYDQTGNGWNVLQAADDEQPALVTNCLSGGTLPCLLLTPGNNGGLLTAVDFGTLAQPLTHSFVGERTGNTSNFNVVVSCGTGGAVQTGFSNTAGNAVLYAGTVVSEPATENVLHDIQAVYNGSSSSMNVDGALTGSLSPGSSNCSGVQLVYPYGAGGNPFTGYTAEMLIDSSALSSTNQNLRCHNARIYYGMSGSC
jgi:hypothetical protein